MNAIGIGQGNSLTPRQNKDRQTSQNRHDMYLDCFLGKTDRTSKASSSILLFTQRIPGIRINTTTDDVPRRLASITPRYGY
jgi:hypothetical protein